MQGKKCVFVVFAICSFSLQQFEEKNLKASRNEQTIMKEVEEMNIRERWWMHKSIDTIVVGATIEICFSLSRSESVVPICGWHVADKIRLKNLWMHQNHELAKRKLLDSCLWSYTISQLMVSITMWRGKQRGKTWKNFLIKIDFCTLLRF